MLKRISYYSRRQRGHSDSEVRDLLVPHAAARNGRAGVTGCLWFGSHAFVQVLEGSPAALEAAMHRISRDPRHDQIRVLSKSQAVLRLFESNPLKLVDAYALPGLGDLASSIAAGMSDDAAPHEVVLIPPSPFVQVPDEVARHPELAVPVPSMKGVIAYESLESRRLRKRHSPGVVRSIVSLLSELVAAVPSPSGGEGGSATPR